MSLLVAQRGRCSLDSQSGECVLAGGIEGRVLLEQPEWRVCLSGLGGGGAWTESGECVLAGGHEGRVLLERPE